MAIRYNVESAKWDNGLHLYIENPIGKWNDSRRMLVDSDHLSFIYVLEMVEDLVYIGIPKGIWEDLNQAMKEQSRVLLASSAEGETIELSALVEEMRYLTENIYENANYGQDMNEAVQHVFFADQSEEGKSK